VNIKIHEIYASVQGESSFTGLPCGFIRTAGCSLRCHWCDTPEAWKGGQEMSLNQILDRVERLEVPLVEVTGGEPLEQEATFNLLDLLVEKGFSVLLETGGHIPCQRVNPAVHRIIDMKCPGSKMSKHNHMQNLDRLSQKDEIKFVINHKQDFDWSCSVVREYDLLNRAQVLFSPVHNEMDPKQLVDWILGSGLQVRFQIQIHKAIWGSEVRGV